MLNSNRIVGGKYAGQMIPWQVRAWGCGGTILDKCTILSAAHCSGNTPGRKIRAGVINLFGGGAQVIIV